MMSSPSSVKVTSVVFVGFFTTAISHLFSTGVNPYNKIYKEKSAELICTIDRVKWKRKKR
jgi:hypothetical protein